MSERAEFDWMRGVMRSLFDDLSRERATDAIRSTESFRLLSAELRSHVPGIPEGDYGDNLLMAIVALRVKFPPEEAMAKLELNIAMRSERGGATR